MGCYMRYSWDKLVSQIMPENMIFVFWEIPFKMGNCLVYSWATANLRGWV